MTPVTDLSNIDPDEVAIVKRGAIRRVFDFFKADENDGDVELLKETADALAVPLENEAELVAKWQADGLSESEVEANVVIARLEKAAKKAVPTDAEMNTDENSGDNEAEPDADDLKKEDDPESPEPPLAKSGDDLAGVHVNDKEHVMADGLTGLVQKEDGSWDTTGVEDPAARSFYDNVLKSLDDAKAEGESLRESVKKAEADNAELKDKLVVKEITAAAEGEYSKIAKTDELVPVLKAAKDSLPAEQYEKLAEILKAANARIEAGDLFAELGRSADPVIKDAIARGANFPSGGGDAWDQIVEKANAMVIKDGEDLNDDQRVDRFLKTADGKRLYADYMAEQHGSVA